jgi:hypothetical protein
MIYLNNALLSYHKHDTLLINLIFREINLDNELFQYSIYFHVLPDNQILDSSLII